MNKWTGVLNRNGRLGFSRVPVYGTRSAGTPIRQIALVIALLASCVSGNAQSSTESTAETRVFTLGTQGGPIFNPKRAQPANAVVVGDRIYLVDAGNGVAHQLALAGLDPRRVGVIFITHNHDDHNADWGTLVGMQWSLGRRSPVRVFGPNGTESMREGFLRYFEPNARIRAADVKKPVGPEAVLLAKDIQGSGLVFQDDRVKVTAAEVCHFHFDPKAMPAGGPHKSFAYRFETKDKVVVFSGDTGKCATLVDFARGADVLVHEVVSLPLIEKMMRAAFASAPDKPPEGMVASAMRHMAEDHTTPEDIGKLAAEAGVKKVVLSHFVPGGEDDPESAYVDGVKKHYHGPVVAAQDLMVF